MGYLHNSGSLPRSPIEALRHAQGVAQGGGQDWPPGMCENFVASMYGAVGLGGYSSASDQWANIPSNLKNNGTNAPKGALVFWGGGDGHVAISAGNGMVWTTDFSGDGRVTLVRASDITEQWGKPVSGWAQPYWGGHTVHIPADADTGGGPEGGRDGHGNDGDNQGDGHNNSDYGFNPEFLRKHPEIKQLINQAQKHDWSDAHFQQELKDTDWWEETTRAQRAWQVLSTEEPAEAESQIADKAKDLRAQAARMGIDLSGKEAQDLATKALRNNMTAQETLSFLAKQFDMTGKHADKNIDGTAATTVDQLKEMAYAYGVPTTNKRLERQVQQVLAGKMDVAGLQDFYKEQAQGLFPTIAKQLDHGRTVDDIMQSYTAMASNELGLNEDQMSLLDPKWTKALTGGANGLMTQDEWLETIRSNHKYGFDNTDNARATASDLANSLKAAMGNGAI